MNRKVTVVGGAGNVGATVARAIADKELADVVIIDLAEQKAGGVALDMLEACPIEGSDARVAGYGATDEGWKQTAGSDVVVITSGMPRKPGSAYPRKKLNQRDWRLHELKLRHRLPERCCHRLLLKVLGLNRPHHFFLLLI